MRLLVRSFRPACVCALALIVLGPPVAKAQYRVCVSNEISGDITVFDGESLRVEKTFPVGRRPRGMAAIPGGSEVLVAVSGSPRGGPGQDGAHSGEADKSQDGLAVVDVVGANVLRRLNVGSDPESVALTPDGQRAFVANEDAELASGWELSTGRRVAQAKVSAEPEGVAVHPSRPEVFVGCEVGGDIYVLDTANGAPLGRIQVGGRPRSIAFTPDGKTAVVALEVDGAVALIDVAQRRLAAKVKIEPAPALPMGVAISPDGATAFVSTGRGGKVAVINLQTLTVETLIAVGKRPWGVALSPDGRRLFVANGPSNDVSVIDTAARREIGRVPVGKGPWGVAILRP